MPIVRTEHVELFVAARRAPGASIAMVLIHGAGGTHLDWPATLRAHPQADVYAVDLPGHGKSAEPGRTSISAYADDIVALVNALALERVVLCGHSMGGAVAQAVALRQPPWLAGLFLIGTGARLPVSDAVLDHTVEQFAAVAGFIARFAWSTDADPTLVALTSQRLSQVAPEVVHGDFVACSQFDVRERLAAITVPTVVISASDDRMMPAKFGRTLAAGILNARYAEIEHAGHFMHVEQPDAVLPHLRALLEQIGAPQHANQPKSP